MKPLYEGILGDVDTNIAKMDNDMTIVTVIEWLKLHCRPNYGMLIRTGRPLKGHMSTDEDWYDTVKVNSDGSVDILSDLTICWNMEGHSIMPGNKIPFKLHKVHGHFLVGRTMSDISNFPDIVDTVEFAKGIKVNITNWHVKVENSRHHGFGYYKNPFLRYTGSDMFPAVYIQAGATIGKNVVFECTRTNHTDMNRPVAAFASLTDSKLKNIKLINFPYIVLEEIRASIPTPEALKKYNNNVKDVKMITSNLYDLVKAPYYEGPTRKVGMLLRNKDGQFEYVDNKWFMGDTPTKIQNDLLFFQTEYKDLL